MKSISRTGRLNVLIVLSRPTGKSHFRYTNAVPDDMRGLEYDAEMLVET